MRLETLTQKLNNARLMLLAANHKRSLSNEELESLKAFDLYMKVATATPATPLLKIMERFNEIDREMKKIERLMRKRK